MATLLGSSSMVLQYGVSGSYWYAVGGGIQLVLFAIVGFAFKIRAPGAKTVLQFIRVQFGRGTHILFITYFLFCSFVIFAGMLVDATNSINAVVENLMPEFSCMLLALLIGGYTIVGGLGGTFYVSFANAVVLFVLILIFQAVVFFNPSGDPCNPFGNNTRFYELLDCWEERSLISNSSFTSFGSNLEWKFGFSNFFLYFGFTVFDQGAWQGAVASKPGAGVVGIILAGFTWMSISIGLASTAGLTLVGLSSAQGFPILTEKEINQGLVFPAVANVLMGTSGTYLMLTLILLAIMTTGSSQVIAISSIIIYDIYEPYIQPYIENLPDGFCKLCQNKFDISSMDAFKEEVCECASMRRCTACILDDTKREKAKEKGKLVLPHYTCSIHKEYRAYQKSLLQFANWCVVITTITTVPIIWPLTSIANSFDLSLANVVIICGILINSGWVPMALAILWKGTSSTGLTAGCVTGLILGGLAWLITALQQEAGITLASGASENPLLFGNITSLLSSLIITVLVSMLNKKNHEVENPDKSLTIINPLTPWIANYENDLNVTEGARYIDTPDFQTIWDAFKKWWLVSFLVPIGLSVLLMLILPLSLQSEHFSLSSFKSWINLSVVWTIFSALCNVVLPIIQQVHQVYRVKFKSNYPPHYVID